VELVETLRQRLSSDSIRCGRQIRRLYRDGSLYRAETTAGEVYGADTVVASMPLHVTQKITEGLSSELSSALEEHRSVSTAIVFLAFRKEGFPHPLDGYGFVVPASEGRRIAAGTFISTKFPNRSPESHVLLRVFLGGARDTAVLDRSDEELVELAGSELGGILGDLSSPVFSRVVRWDNATPQVEVGHGEKLARLDRSLKQLPGLQIVANGLRGVGIPDCIGDGRRAAREAINYLTSPRTS
jgi:oxygen-dependent protoporphyrinogen oxidase